METCICCREPVSEGRMVCRNCERKWETEQTKNDDGK